MFRRRSTTEPVAGSPAGAPTKGTDTGATVARSAEEAAEALERLGGKGRPTPKRRESEAARRQRLSPPRDRKEAARLMREKRRAERLTVQEALRTGDERHLPARDRGKVRRFCRDLVDARYNAAEFLLPLLVLILVAGFIPTAAAAWAQLVLWLTMIVGTVLDTGWLIVRTRRELARRFPEENRRGAVTYAVLRSAQLRRLRLPRPQVERGAALPERY